MNSCAAGVTDRAATAALGIYQSSGGLMSVEAGGRVSGANGLVRARRRGLSVRCMSRVPPGRGNVITLDMGGTSADVCLIRDGESGYWL